MDEYARFWFGFAAVMILSVWYREEMHMTLPSSIGAGFIGGCMLGAILMISFDDF